MDLNEKLFDAYRRDDWAEMHRLLDDCSSDDPEMQSRAANWRANALIGEGRYHQALDFLRVHKNSYNCKTLAYMRIAEVLHVLGRDYEAIDELKSAPMDVEHDVYPGLVVDAKYTLAHFQALNGLPVETRLLDDIPGNYIHIEMDGHRISKADLLKLISQSTNSKKD
jgi:hypothetical protein